MELMAPQRQPMLPFANDQRRPLMCAILDSLVIFIRHNIRSALDMDTHMCGRAIVGRSSMTDAQRRPSTRSSVHILAQDGEDTTRCGQDLAQLALSRIIDYDWTYLWRAVLSLTAFVAARKDAFASSPRAGALVDAILLLLDFACAWSGLFGAADASTPTALFFEILRSERAIFDLGTWATSLARADATRPVSATDECLRNLRAVVAHFGDPIAKQRAALGESGQLEPDQVLALIRAHEESLDLEDSPALEDVRCVAPPRRRQSGLAEASISQAVHRVRARDVPARAAEERLRRPARPRSARWRVSNSSCSAPALSSSIWSPLRDLTNLARPASGPHMARPSCPRTAARFLCMAPAVRPR